MHIKRLMMALIQLYLSRYVNVLMIQIDVVKIAKNACMEALAFAAFASNFVRLKSNCHLVLLVLLCT